MARDQERLRRQLDRARGLKDRVAQQTVLEEIAAAVEAAEQRVANRRAGVPTPRYPAGLPVSERKDEIAAVIAAHPVVIVAGETGSGKSTQLPKICLEVGRGVRGMIGHTQPRRLAARAVAERVAEELGGEVGGAVGYAVRFTDRVSERTLVKVMTDGILLAEIQRDRLLSAYDTIIVDEAHERSLNIDFILGYLRQLLPRRPDLKVIVTSATIDTERFSRHFGGAPIVEVTGRTYPVEVRYRPLVDPDGRREGVSDGDGDSDGGDYGRDDGGEERDQIQAIGDAVAELAAEGPGDILVFLSGERDIRDTAEALAALALPDTELLPLYARLSAADQHRVFQPHPGRRIVLATNVAETSLTVPGILSVVDPGTARISRYSHRTKVQRLPIEPVSQASANQRAGRCGRVAPGVCIRLYSETDFRSRPEFTEPEIVRTNLASVILQMAAIGLGDVARFPFVDPPDARSIKDGVALLEELGALDPSESNPKKRLTPLGRRLAQLPLDPRLGRMVLEAETNGCLDEVMVIAAALSIQDPRERPLEKQGAATEAHGRFADKESDFLSYLRLWEYLQERQEALSSNQFRKLCKAEFLNFLRIREWQDIHGQLRQVMRNVSRRGGPTAALGSRPADEPKLRQAIHVSLLAGLLSHIGIKSGPRDEYQGARAARFSIAPGSVLFKSSAGWVMAAELVETTRLWARVVARIEPEWAERLGAHLVKRSYSEPHWDSKRGEAMAYERVTLYGLPVVTARKVSYNRVDPAAARDLFIRLALVEGDWRTPHPFWAENRKLVEEVRGLATRVRRNDVLVDDEVLLDFYDQRVAPEVTSARTFDGWWKKERATRPDLLRFTRELLINPATGALDVDAYPDVWRYRNLEFRLSYEFDPGSTSDGVTVHIPLPVLDQVDPGAFEWQVPGLRADIVAALIRSLPKEVRRSFVPVPDYTRAALDRISPVDGPLPETLARELGRLTGDPIPPGSWQWDRVPPHLRMRFLVEDEAGRELAAGKDLRGLQDQLAERAEAGLAVAASTFEHDGLKSWAIGTLPREVDVTWAGFRRRAYPALVDQSDSVAVRVLATPEEQRREMWAGTRRLLLLTLPNPARAAERRLSNDTQLALARSPYPKVSDLFDDCVVCAVDQLLADLGGPVWTEAAFTALRTGVAHVLTESVVYIVTVVAGVLAIANGIDLRLAGLRVPSLAPSIEDIERQMAGLVGPGFVAATGAGRLPHLLRYLEAIELRLDRLPTGADRDFDNLRRVQRLERRYGELLGALGPDVDEAAAAIRWMIEELRVSYFAQSLGTAQTVSEKRILREIDRYWSEAG
ncbi:MAG TPA: ATP-dependent RNA helicase HrpA [Acidimicrobiia bacterium]|nr:ATP-dependent RNA helicase HrpA [Acidimicrobiia bacterium]